MGISVAVTRVACSTAAGNQFITAPGLGDLTPKAAYFIVTQAVTDGVAADHAVLGIGAATGAANRWAISWRAQNGVGTTSTGRHAMTDECVMKINTGNNAVDGEADFVAFIPNGVQINWGNAPASAFLMTVILFAGTDLNAQADVFTMAAAQNGTVDINTVGFEPDTLLTAGHANPFDDVGYDNSFVSYGLVLNKTADEQYAICNTSANGLAASRIGGQITTNYGIAWCSATTGNALLAGEFGTFDAQGFSCTTRLNPAVDSEAIGFLALSFGGVVDFEGGIIASPIATGDDNVVDPGFTPQAVIAGLSQMPVVNTSYINGESASVGLHAFDANYEFSTSIQDEDGQGTTDAQSISDDQLTFPQDDGSAGHVATFVSFDTLGWTWNFTTTQGTAVQWWYLAIGRETPVVTSAVEVITPSHWQSQALTVSVFEPTISSYTPDGTYIESFIDAEGLNFTIQAVGGYWDCRFNVSDRLERLNAWLDNGVGRHIEVYSPELVKIWEGFVNKVTLNVGGFTVVRGPLMDIANDVVLIYSTVDTTVSPPLTGVRETSAAVVNADSQAQFGIVEKVLSAGGVPVAQVTDILDTYIAENNLPETSKSLTSGGANTPSVSVECFGYVHWLRLYAYNQIANTGEIDLSTKIENILTADPNTLFSTDYTGVEANTLQVKRWENNNRTAWALIRSLVAKGDAAGNRYTFGIYNDRRAIYAQVPTTVEYQQRLADPSQRFETPSGLEVKPWNLTAARFLFFPDFLIGRTQPATILREDPRALFIEGLTYTAPWSVSINGGKVETLNQKLAQLGLAGIGAN